MYKDAACVVVVAAGGSGERLGGEIPKQFRNLAGVPSVARAVMLFEKNPFVDGVVTIINQNYKSLWDDIKTRYCFRKLIAETGGGKTRQESVLLGLKAAAQNAPKNALVLIHDAARPLTRQTVINNVIQSTYERGGAIAVSPVTDTVKSAHDGLSVKTVDRSNLYLAQTPQGFRLGQILAAHQKAVQDGFSASDDAALMEREGLTPFLVDGGTDNIKITAGWDMTLAELIIAAHRPD